jgi:hypothetical protein
MSATQTVTVTVPAKFWDDHIKRFNLSAIEETSVAGGKKYRLVLDHAAWEDLLSDADYYIDFLQEYDAHSRALGVSAAWTVSALAKVDVPWPTDNAKRWLRDLPSWAAPKKFALWTVRRDI